MLCTKMGVQIIFAQSLVPRKMKRSLLCANYFLQENEHVKATFSRKSFLHLSLKNEGLKTQCFEKIGFFS